MTKIKLGFCLCGSFCTFQENFTLLEQLSGEYDIIPIMSFNASKLDTRFGKAQDHILRIESICNRTVIKTIEGAEPIGPTKMTDIMIISPCTGNTLAKLASAITDTPVTMAVKSHLRNNLPVVVSVATNDALSASAKNIGELQSRKNYYFVPMGQDDQTKKPTSLVAKLSYASQTIKEALEGRQLQPMLLGAYRLG